MDCLYSLVLTKSISQTKEYTADLLLLSYESLVLLLINKLK